MSYILNILIISLKLSSISRNNNNNISIFRHSIPISYILYIKEDINNYFKFPNSQKYANMNSPIIQNSIIPKSESHS